MSSGCRFLTWDSEFFGLRIGQLESHGVHSDDPGRVMDWCADQRIDCLYFLAESRCQTSARFAENAGFLFKDVRLTLDWKPGCASDRTIAPARMPVVIRHYRDSDLDSLIRGARVSHLDSRFFFDANFGRTNAERLFETWIRNASTQRTANVFVAEADGNPVGYVVCNLPPGGEPSIGLAAVDAHYRGQGFGSDLLHRALQWFLDQGSSQVRVVTQGRNVEAQRLYQRAGFSTRSVECWYHKWFR